MVVSLALVVLYGWITDIAIFKTLLPGRPDMKANAAICFLLASCSAFLALFSAERKWAHRLSAFLAIFILAYSALVLLEYAFGYDFGIDELLFLDPNGLHGHSPPGRFSPVTALNFILFSLGILFFVLPKNPWCRTGQTFFMLVFVNAIQSFVGMAFGISHIFGMNEFIPMAVHTSFSFTLLSSALLAFHSDQGLMERFTSPLASALMARRMMIASILVFPILKVISDAGVNNLWFNRGVAMFLQSMGGIIFMAIIVIVTAGALLRNEKEQALTNRMIDQNREDLKKAKEEAEAASHAKSQFLANMSHEIRTPLGIILGFSELGLESLENPQEAANYLKAINRNAHELSKLIGEILDLSKVEANKLEAEKLAFSWISLLEEVCGLLRVKAEEKGIRLHLSIEHPVPNMIESDPTRLRQILINLIGNAVKFTSRGVVQVKASARFEEKLDQYCLQIQVKDSGIGISPDQQKVLFQPFSQADNSMTRKFGGTGLGLVLSKQIAQALGGNLVLLESRPGLGSVFLCTLYSRKLEQMSLLPQKQKDVLGLNLRHLNLLVVDDSIDNQILIQHYLRPTGARISVANNGLEAVNRATQDSFDLILMDIQMPVMDGFRALTELRAQGFAKPIVAITAHALKEEQERAFKAGFNDYLTKPISKSQLVTVLQKAAEMQADANELQ
jgi:signal transduction histidine kinase/CheY-like chemotaxis protein